jgi:hypothetical protein
MPAPGGDGFQLGRRVRPVLGDLPPRGKSPEGSRQPGGETRRLLLAGQPIRASMPSPKMGPVT